MSTVEERNINDYRVLDATQHEQSMLTMLDMYCGCVLAYLDDPKALFGSAVAMRKAVEMLGAYLIRFYPAGNRNAVNITNGNEVFPRENDIAAAVSISPSCIERMKNLLYVAVLWEGGEESTKYLGMNGILHYQGYRGFISEKDDQTTEKEIEYLIWDHESMQEKIRSFSALLKDLLDEMRLTETVQQGQDYSNIRKLALGEALQEDDFKLITSEIDEIKKRKADTQNAVYVWSDYIAQIYQQYENKFEHELEARQSDPVKAVLAVNTLYSCSRMIAEKSLYMSIKAKIKTASFPDNATLDKYINRAVTSIINAKDNPLSKQEKTVWNKRRICAEYIRDCANQYMHWQNQPVGEAQLQNIRRMDDEIMKRLHGNVSALMNDLVIEGLPKSVVRMITPIIKPHQKLKWVLSGIGTAAIILGLTFFGVNAWNNREIIHNYADYGWLDGELVGVTELDKEAASQRLHYRFVEQKGLLRRVEHVDGEGRIRNEYVLQSRPAAMQLRYGETEQLTEIVAYNEQGKELYQLKFNGDKETTRHVEFYSAQGAKLLPLPMDVKNIDVYTWGDSYQKLTGIDSVQVMRQSAQSVRVSFTRLDDSRSDSNHVSGMVYQYDAAGRLSEIRYEYDSGMMQDADTLVRRVLVYGESGLTGWLDYSAANALMEYEYQYDETGRCVGIQYKDIITGLLTETQGIASETYDYNENGQRTGLHYLNKALEPVLSDAGYATHTWRYDEDGRLVEEAYYDTEKNLIVPDGGWARKAVTYDGAKELTSYFGADNKAVNIADADHKDYPYAKVQVEQNGSVRTVVRYDAEGKRVLFPGNVFEWRYTYDALGREIKAEAYGLNGQPVLAYNNYFMYEEEYNANGQKTEQLWYDTDGETVIAKAKYHYNSRNLMDEMSRYTYQSDQDALAHAYTARYTYNEKALETKIEYQDEQGGLMPCPGSVIAVIETKYNPDGDIEERFYLDEKEQLVNYPSVGYARWVAEYENGHRTKISQYGEDGELAVASNGFAVERMWYDNAGNVLGWAYYDEKEQPMIYANDGISSARRTYDDAGNVTELYYYDTQEKLIISPKYGYAVLRSTYDDAGRQTSWSYFDENDQPMILSKNGYASASRTYDKAGNILETRYYDTQGNLMIPAKYGYAIVHTTYDEKGQEIAGTYYDENKQPMISPEKGFATIRKTYDEDGNETEWSYYDENDQPMLHLEKGFASACRIYDDAGNILETRYYDTQGNLMISAKYGYAVLRSTYDEKGQEIAWTYYDENEQPMVHAEYGYATIRKTYDEDGNETEWSYYDENDQPMIHLEKGYAIIRKTYDAMGNVTKTSFYDTNDKLMFNTIEGYATALLEYDAIGRRTKWSYYDENNKPVVQHKEGYASCQCEYDANGNAIKFTIYGADGELMVSPVFGYAVQKSEFDDAGHETVTRYFNENEEPMLHPEYGYAMIQKDYNNAGKVEETRYYDTQENLMISAKYGYAILRSTYDEKGQEIAWAYFDENEQPMIRPEYGYASASRTYDEAGNAVEVRCYDTQGQLIVSPKLGYAILRSTYDEKGQEIAWVHLDENEQPLLLPEFGYASVSRTFDENGNETSFSYFDENGQPMLHPEYGYASASRTYDEAGNAVEVRCYDTQGQLIVSPKLGYAILRSTYDEKGQEIAWAYFDENGQPMLRPEYGYASASRTYDEAGNAVEIRYYDLQGQLIVSPKLGYAVLHSTYDEKGREIAWAYFDENEQPMISQEYGYAAVRKVYDDEGHVLEESYYDANGQLIGLPGSGSAMIQRVYDGGKLIQSTSYNQAGDKMSVYRYDENEKLLEQTNYHEGGDYTVYEYGVDGRAEYWHHYDAEGNLAAISDLGNAGGRYYHDEEGRTYAEDFYNEENVPFLRRENDEEGNAVEWIDLDEQGNPLQKEEEAS